MPTGDSLAIILALASFAVAFLVGGITAPPGWRANTLWVGTAILLLVLVAWLALPAATPLWSAIKPIIQALFQSGALVMVGTVSIVALMQGKRPQQGTSIDDLNQGTPPQRPSFVASHNFSKWEPDVPLAEGLSYFSTNSGEVGYYDKADDVLIKFVTAIREGKITSWGKGHPSDREFQIRPEFWNWAEVTLDTNCVFSKRYNSRVYDVRVCKSEMEKAWPSKAS